MKSIGFIQGLIIYIDLSFPNLKHLSMKSDEPFNIILMRIEIYSLEGQNANDGSNEPEREPAVGISRITKDDDVPSFGMALEDLLIRKGEGEPITELTGKEPIPYLQGGLHAGRGDMKTLNDKGYNDEVKDESGKDYLYPLF